MTVDFSNQWFRETCIESGLDPDNALSQSTIDLAKDCAIKMKYYMGAKERYTNNNATSAIDIEISKWNERRIGHMLNALFYAEVMNGLPGFDEFIKKRMN